MIILKSEKINPQFEEIIKNYENRTNYGLLICPYCKSTNNIRWGTYERNAIYLNGNSILEAKILKVQRIKCKSCNKTHALLPFGIIPYKQFTDQIISKVLFMTLNNSIDNISNKYKIEPSIIKKWLCQFKKYHLSKVSIITGKHNIIDMLNIFLSSDGYKQKYIVNFNNVFMQIKLGILSLCPS